MSESIKAYAPFGLSKKAQRVIWDSIRNAADTREAVWQASVGKGREAMYSGTMLAEKTGIETVVNQVVVQLRLLGWRVEPKP